MSDADKDAEDSAAFALLTDVSEALLRYASALEHMGAIADAEKVRDLSDKVDVYRFGGSVRA